MSEFKPCPVCQEQSDQCLSCASYVVDGERIYYEKLKDFGATKDHEVRFINRSQKHRVTAFFHNGKLYIPSRQGRSVPLAIGLQWDAWQEQQAKINELQKRVDDLELTIKGAVTFVDLQIEATEQGREAAIGTQAKNWWSSKLLMLRPVRRVLEQALKGGNE
ncbi:hypothetical protein [Acinetobacter johnsonii]|uniref:Uncharacterized protein n=1 Tax=Acinetobacter johnsonii TaxID=40214 RepID=A0A427V4D8_ACIJO|nr:hypothetical protein [Acinetobacter johnsonii]RSE27610.1 hypothetical protein EGT73_00940 [Acinetobacter johnsonii]